MLVVSVVIPDLHKPTQDVYNETAWQCYYYFNSCSIVEHVGRLKPIHIIMYTVHLEQHTSFSLCTVSFTWEGPMISVYIVHFFYMNLIIFYNNQFYITTVCCFNTNLCSVATRLVVGYPFYNRYNIYMRKKHRVLMIPVTVNG